MTIGKLYDADNVVVGQAATVFAQSKTPAPDPTKVNMNDPFDLTPWNSGASKPWTECGATDQGWTFSADKNTSTINIEEQSTPVATSISDQTVTIQGSLSEDITRTLTLVLNATSTSTAATASSPGYDVVTLSDQIIHYAVGMMMTNAAGFVRWIYIPEAVSVSNAETSFRRASDKRMYPCTFTSTCEIGDIKIFNFTDKKTS